ncbi:FKBP-type peptidyl-prolyl cis-trans isomerase [Pedobacter sp.]|uniref:FKBP-type peptidyl-prolyl cis-trans isomerase n=1 Tax=Pedobacter sp. TaxID=1411316 RepID=UPI003D7F67E7
MAIAVLSIAVSACQKEVVPYDPVAQYSIDTTTIRKFIEDKKLVGVKEHNGLFYQIIKAGTGKEDINLVDTVEVNYEGRLLDGTVFDASEGTPIKFELGSVIKGWQEGIPLGRQGGQIRLIIPSTMAYTNIRVGPIPPNSPLDFTVDIVKVYKYKPKQ